MAARDVLVVDDEEPIRRLVVTLLERRGLSCDTACDGVEAIGRLEKQEYRVVLLDLMMPRLDGRAVIRRMRGWLKSQIKPVVLVVTAFPENDSLSSEGDVVHAILRKPFDIHELSDIVRDCVQARRLLPD